MASRDQTRSTPPVAVTFMNGSRASEGKNFGNVVASQCRPVWSGGDAAAHEPAVLHGSKFINACHEVNRRAG